MSLSDDFLFYVGQKFASHAELDSFIQNFEKKESVQLNIRTCKKHENPVIKYKNLVLCCKAGGREFKTKSKGLRLSRFRINLNAPVNQDYLIVTSLADQHSCQIAGNGEIFSRLPKQRRPDEQAIKMIKDIKSCKGNTKSLITKLKDEFGKYITSRDILNILAKEKKLNKGTDLEKLLDAMKSIRESSIYIEHENNMVNCIFFQDRYMRDLYLSSPEILFIDATYKLNQNRMCLLVLMIVDGNGESGVVGLAFMKSESEACTLSALESFKKAVGNIQETEIIMADKDMGNRNAFEEVFPHSKIHICIFHVIQTFIREITCGKRNISAEQRDKVLNILKNMVYSPSEEHYLQLYHKLCEMQIPRVKEYFDVNWHNIRDQWVMFGQNTVSHFMNRTNNRLERFNRELQEAVGKYSEISYAFTNVMTVVRTLRDIRSQKAIEMILKQRNEILCPTLKKYSEYLTDYAFKKLRLQFEISHELENFSVNGESATHLANDKIYHVDLDKCTCSFFNVMKLPCRHLLKLLRELDKEEFIPDLCAHRWTISRFRGVTKKLIDVDGEESLFIGRNKHRDLNPRSFSTKFRELKSYLLDIADLVSAQPDHIYEYVFGEITALKDKLNDKLIEIAAELNGTSLKSTDEKCFCGVDNPELNIDSFMCSHCKKITHSTCHGFLNSFSPAYDTRFDIDANFSCWRCPITKYSDKNLKNMSAVDLKKLGLKRLAIKNLLVKGSASVEPAIKEIQDALNINQINTLVKSFFTKIDLLTNLDQIELMYEHNEFQQPTPEISQESCSGPSTPLPIGIDHNYSGRIAQLVLPPVPVNVRAKNSRISTRSTTIKTFNELNAANKKRRMISWLNLSLNIEAIMAESIKINRSNVESISQLALQKFRNDFVDTQLVEQFFDADGFGEFKNKLKNLKNKRWLCHSCMKSTGKNTVIACDACLAWYHLRCVGLKNIPKGEFYKCPDCV